MSWLVALGMRSEGKMENQKLVSPSQQCSNTPVGFGQGFLCKEQGDHTKVSPILSWPGCSWYVPVSLTETSIEGRCFCDVTDIINNTTEELKRLSQNFFQKCFQGVYIRCQNCIVARGGGAFRIKCVLNDDTVLYFSEIIWSRKHSVATTYTSSLMKQDISCPIQEIS